MKNTFSIGPRVRAVILTAIAMAATALMSQAGRASELLHAQPEVVGLSSERLAAIDQSYAKKVEEGELAGIVLLIARRGKIAHLSAIGYADIERKEKMATDTIFRLYSMTKPIATTALMMLYEEGRFQLTDPISKFMPEFAGLRVLRTLDSALEDTVEASRAPTVQDLMRHTAGFLGGFEDNAIADAYRKASLLDIDVSIKQEMKSLAKIPLAYQPGTRIAYSNPSFDAQSRLVEVLSGMSFDAFLASRLFKPLEMKDTGFWLRPDKAQRLATVYWRKNGALAPLDATHGCPCPEPQRMSWLTDPRAVNSYTADHARKAGSYGLVGTAEDYWRFAQMILNGGELEGTRVLSPMTVRHMGLDHLDALGIPAQNGGLPGTSWGLGFAILKDPAAAGYVGSEGTLFWGGAANTTFWIDPQEDLIVVAMTQHMFVPELQSLSMQMHALVYGALTH